MPHLYIIPANAAWNPDYDQTQDECEFNRYLRMGQSGVLLLRIITRPAEDAPAKFSPNPIGIDAIPSDPPSGMRGKNQLKTPWGGKNFQKSCSGQFFTLFPGTLLQERRRVLHCGKNPIARKDLPE